MATWAGPVGPDLARLGRVRPRAAAGERPRAPDRRGSVGAGPHRDQGLAGPSEFRGATVAGQRECDPGVRDPLADDRGPDPPRRFTRDHGPRPGFVPDPDRSCGRVRGRGAQPGGSRSVTHERRLGGTADRLHIRCPCLRRALPRHRPASLPRLRRRSLAAQRRRNPDQPPIRWASARRGATA